MPKPLNVFISYAHKDGAKLASQLQADLTGRGYDTWLDRARLQGGSNWSREIEQALDNADVVLALLSAGSFESEVCRGEQLRSLRHRKCVIPVLVHVRADRPVYLEARQFRDFSEQELYSPPPRGPWPAFAKHKPGRSFSHSTAWEVDTRPLGGQLIPGKNTPRTFWLREATT